MIENLKKENALVVDKITGQRDHIPANRRWCDNFAAGKMTFAVNTLQNILVGTLFSEEQIDIILPHLQYMAKRIILLVHYGNETLYTFVEADLVDINKAVLTKKDPYKYYTKSSKKVVDYLFKNTDYYNRGALHNFILTYHFEYHEVKALVDKFKIRKCFYSLLRYGSQYFFTKSSMYGKYYKT